MKPQREQDEGLGEFIALLACVGFVIWVVTQTHGIPWRPPTVPP